MFVYLPEMKNLSRYFLIFQWCVGAITTIAAQQDLPIAPDQRALTGSVLTLDHSPSQISLDKDLEIRMDPGGRLSVQDMLSEDETAGFQAFSGGEILPENAAYWGRITINNQLDADSAQAEWVLSFSALLTAVDVYVLDSAQLVHRSTGIFSPLSQRAFSPVNDQNLVKVIIPPRSLRTIYFRAASAIDQEITILPPTLQSLETMLTGLARQKKESGFFVGFMFMILVYSLILYFFQRDNAYLYYSGYVFTLILWWSFNRGELLDLPLFGIFEAHPQYVYFFKLSTYVGLFFYLAFIRTFLELKNLLPRWDRVFKFMVWAGIPLLLIDAIILGRTNFSLTRADQLSVFYILSFVVLTYLFLLPLYKTRDKRGIFIILGMLAMGGGFLMTAFHRYSTSGFTLTYFQVGTFIEVTIFSLGLAYRSNQVRKERQQAAFDLEKSRIQEQKQEAESRQLRELSEIKTRFYTNITHEFRTPLTVIMGMAEQLKEQSALTDSRGKLIKGLQLIYRNSRHLLGLINQLLDLSRIDSGTIRMEFVQGNIVTYLQYLAESFYSMAEEKQVRLVFYTEEESIIMDYDEEKIQQIVYNLLSNAIKFTPERGKIIFHVSRTNEFGGSTLQLKVKDSGIGIAADQLPLVFDRFYQTDNSSTRKAAGSGIGLALTKELVELLKGDIQVTSTPGQGSTFKINLPIKNTAPQPAAAPKNGKEQLPNGLPVPVTPNETAGGTPPPPDSDLPLLLLIEDNPDVAAYIGSLLEKDYLIHLAENGQAGIDQAIALVPDIIISDVMMPEKNGYEVCATLKQDERTSHIPIILLTARATQEDRLEGLQFGADAYLTKPFNKQELQIRLEKLIEIRKKLQQHFSTYTSRPVDTGAQEVPDDPETLFLEKLTKVVQANLENPDFGVPQLAEAVLMSQMQVYRKLKALTGQTGSQFIRSLRLQRGRELLQTTDLTISEIAYDVGYSDPNYFSRTFHQEFKKPPSDFRS